MRKFLAAVLMSLASLAAVAAESELFEAKTFAGLKARNLGPALMSGRIVDIAKDPSDSSVWYVAVASGGVWKTSNAGATWSAIFDNESTYSIGCVTVDPNNPKVVWVGTGENNSQRSVGWGDGVYKSLDGGGSWRRMGLERSEHIGKIVLDPRDSDMIWVAAQGPLWAEGGDRGLYKSTDGGESWNRVLHISENTGVSDVVLDPRDPDTVYAASYQRRRHVWALVAGGPESTIHKSTDGGATFREIDRGLPAGDRGRIGLAISPQDPDVLYATVAATEDHSGFYRSDDRGESWDRRSDYIAVDPQYYGELFPDPHHFDRVYAVDVFIHVTEDGGKTFQRMDSEHRHVDNHVIVFDPEDPNYLLVGSDGGIYESHDRGKAWRYFSNLPITQFYRVGIDNAEPFYNLYGGTQDNDTQGGPSRTTNIHGIRNSDWFITVGGDGYQTRVDPEDPNVLYSMWQYGELVRFDRTSGERVSIQPQPDQGEPPLVWNWDSPLMISPHSPRRLYFAADRLLRSDDRGDTWRQVSGDLTRDIDRTKLPVMGRIWPPEAVWRNVFTSIYGNATALDESPLVEGLLYVGTDDGLLNISEDGGETWRRVERFPGVPELTLVADVTASLHDPDTVYVLLNNHKRGDFAPYALVSRDRGRKWKSIAGDLDSGQVTWSLVQDHGKPELLFLGTEFGLFFTQNEGERWIELTGGIPTIAMRDLEIQRREDDLVAASFGRGFFILDDYSPLRLAEAETLEQPAELFPVRDARMYIQRDPLGWGEKATQGHGFFAAPNPPFGAVFTYYLSAGLETRKAKRQKAEAEAIEAGDAIEFPSWEELRAEDREEKPAVYLTVRDADGRAVRRLSAPTTEGFHRVAWDLRYPSEGPLIGRGAGEQELGSGSPVAPGRYTVELAQRVDGVETKLGETRTFEAKPVGMGTLATKDRAALTAFHREAESLARAVWGAQGALVAAKHRLALVRRAADAVPDQASEIQTRARALELRLEDLTQALKGDRTVRSRQEPTLPSIRERVQEVVWAHWSSTSAPTTTHRRQLAYAGELFAGVLEELRQAVDVDLRQLEQDLEAAGAPWTEGRSVPDWAPN